MPTTIGVPDGAGTVAEGGLIGGIESVTTTLPRDFAGISFGVWLNAGTVPAENNTSAKKGVRFIVRSAESWFGCARRGERPAFIKIRLFYERLSRFIENFMTYTTKGYGKLAF